MMAKTAKQYKLSLHWFRKDLRLTDNTALIEALSRSKEVLPVYILSNWKGSHRWTGARRQQFLLGCLGSLQNNLESKGSKLILRSGSALSELERLIEEQGVEAVFANRDPDPFGRACEEALQQLCREKGVDLHLYKDSALHEREEVLTGGGQPYRVYTPYYRNWIGLPKEAPRPLPRESFALSAQKKKRQSLELPKLSHWNLSLADGDELEAGEAAARKRMKLALSPQGSIESYDLHRDTPLLPPSSKAPSSTSRLGQDLRFGLISIRELYAKCQEAMQKSSRKKGYEIYVKELAWREFYRGVLYFFPEVLELEFNKKYRGMPWAQDEGKDAEHFAKWKAAETGFPIVDAGMRELKATGFMHNRVRMIVSMFLTKDLHLDWRLGESWFMQHLLDGEIASNNGGWQWSAGCGADAAPYFRIQNPWTQTKNYDPQGHYIKKWIPELEKVEPKLLQSPPAMAELGAGLAPNYPPPMVDHSEERNLCLERFKKHLSKA